MVTHNESYILMRSNIIILLDVHSADSVYIYLIPAWQGCSWIDSKRCHPCMGCQCIDKQAYQRLPSRYNRVPKPKCSLFPCLVSVRQGNLLIFVHTLGHEPATKQLTIWLIFHKALLNTMFAIKTKKIVFTKTIWKNTADKLHTK